MLMSSVVSARNVVLLLLFQLRLSLFQLLFVLELLRFEKHQLCFIVDLSYAEEEEYESEESHP